MKKLSILIPVGQPAHDHALEAADAVEAAAANGLAGNQREPALDQVQPRDAGRSEVQFKARMSSKPLQDRGMLMGSVVVTDLIQVAPGIAASQ